MRRIVVTVAVLAATFGGALGAGAGNGTPVDRSANALTVAVIGDTPYGSAQFVSFPALLGAIDADPKVDLVLHLGDIKNGSSLCTDAYFEAIKAEVDTLEDPFVFTPGDNEWTDCHRANNGSYVPTERLAKLRATFYPEAGVSGGGRKKQVLIQPGYPENQLWFQSRVAFGVVHVVGSNNDLAPWFGAAETPAQRAARLAEYEGRLAADLAWLDETFALAEDEAALGVVVAMQADMWDGAPLDGFDPIAARIAELAASFGKPVLLLEGDSHTYTVDTPLAGGSPVHGVTVSAPNVTRIVVEGQNTSEWLRLTIDPRADELFTWERVS